MALSKEQAAEVAARTNMSEWQIQQIAKHAQIKPVQQEKGSA